MMERDRPGFSWRRKRIAGELIGASLFELGDGQKIAPYHYEDGQEEWLLVVSGEPTLRTPEGERTLTAGDVACFPAGPDGAHQVGGPGRVLIASTQVVPRTGGQPDSDKLFVRWGTGPEDFAVFRRGDAVDYWEGENGTA
ncbi:MAG: cupin domain-containing protein [Thermoleophilia bacterium]|nr:cupin domain-containing protein [Thermoleophilia bacterium]